MNNPAVRIADPTVVAKKVPANGPAAPRSPYPATNDGVAVNAPTANGTATANAIANIVRNGFFPPASHDHGERPYRFHFVQWNESRSFVVIGFPEAVMTNESYLEYIDPLPNVIPGDRFSDGMRISTGILLGQCPK